MIGIRHEDKSDWEGRVPLVPEDLRRLHDEEGLEFKVQHSPTRAFKDVEFQAAGTQIADSVDDCPIIMGVKEIPPAKIMPGHTYVYFSHVIKGQPANMPALRKLIDSGCTLIDYERIVDDKNRRLVFFGRYAGLAGMIDSLWALGQRLEWEGVASPFEKLLPAHRYDDLAHYERELATVAESIRATGLPESLCPLVCGFAGYGQVSQGAQKIYDLLPVLEVAPEELGQIAGDPHKCYKVVFREEHLVTRREGDAPFDLREYYDHPERYEASFFPYVQHLHLLINCIYWEPKYPRLITREQFGELYGGGRQPRLRVVGDITCDVDGSVACTTHATDPSDPIYVYDPQTGIGRSGVEGSGPVVLAVDFLPCELPVDASRHFSGALYEFVSPLSRADLSRPLAESGLPPELQRATIVYQGELTEPYRYLESHVG